MTTPFNLALHDHMAALSFHYEGRQAAHWEDTGDPENGPGGLSGWPAHDQYTGPNDIFFADENGRMHHEVRDLEFEALMEAMAQDEEECAHYGRNV